MGKTNPSSTLLYRARDPIEAALLQAMLEENGVEAWTAGGQSALGFGELGADALLVDVRVHAEDALVARGLIEAFWRDRGRAEPGPWTCSSCGEANEAGFEACWCCGEARLPVARGGSRLPAELRLLRGSRLSRRWLAVVAAALLVVVAAMLAAALTGHLTPLLRWLGEYFAQRSS